MPLSSVLKPATPVYEPRSVKCPKCGNPTDYRIPRSKFRKMFLPFLSAKRYWCPKCFNRFHVKAV